MIYRQLGGSGIKLPVLTLGAWCVAPREFGVSKESSIGALQKGYELGCTAIETAASYGLGFTEEVVAEAIEGIPRDKITLLTKCGVVPHGNKGRFVNRYNFDGIKADCYYYAGKDSVINQCEESLRRLRTDYIDVFSLHFHDPTTPIGETMEAFDQLLSQGKIRAAGVANYTFEQLQEAAQYVRLSSIKRTYSMLNRQIEQDVVPFCLENGIGVLAYSVLQRGILTGRNYPAFLRSRDENPPEAKLYDPENMKKIRGFLDAITPLALDKGVETTQLCLRWTIEQPFHPVSLIEASNAAQVGDDFRALTISFTEEDMDFINQRLAVLESQLNFEVPMPVPVIDPRLL
jgi:aryl-alcohol dehydrogenase-like predicted oxidoreductase